MNPYQYCSPRAEELPKDLVDDIIKLLNEKRAKIIEFKREGLDSSYQEEELRAVLHFLDGLDLHACYGMVGYRNTYHFPNRKDCDDWLEWIYMIQDKAE